MKILLYSGGIDSLIAWEYLNHPTRLYVNLGTRYSYRELESLRQNTPEPQTVQVRNHLEWGRYEREDAWLPMRNLLLVMLASAEGADTIYLVAQRGEQNIPDRSYRFFFRMNVEMTEQNGRGIIVSPVFSRLDKVEMVKWYLDTGHDPEYLINAFSCYSRDSPCGQCAACWRKFVALTVNGIEYEKHLKGDIRAWGEVHYHPRLGEYDEDRQKEMCQVMGW